MFWAALIFWVLGQIWLVQIVVYPLFAKVGAVDNDGKNDATIAELIRYNWPRTLSISAQSVISFLMLCYVFGDI